MTTRWSPSSKVRSDVYMAKARAVTATVCHRAPCQRSSWPETTSHLQADKSPRFCCVCFSFFCCVHALSCPSLARSLALGESRSVTLLSKELQLPDNQVRRLLPPLVPYRPLLLLLLLLCVCVCFFSSSFFWSCISVTVVECTCNCVFCLFPFFVLASPCRLWLLVALVWRGRGWR